MKDGLTFIAVVLDKSSSMHSVKAATISGFNEFMMQQKLVPGDALVSLVQFGSHVDSPTFDGLTIENVPELNADTYQPSGMTALYDGIGITVNSVGAKLSALPESQRPSKVVVLIMTDGGENSSMEFSRDIIQKMVKHQSEVYGWEFVFIGANQDAVLSAQSIGIGAANALNYTSDSAGTSKAMGIASNSLRSYRSGGARGQFFRANP